MSGSPVISPQTRRVIVVGTSGAGKTTTARAVARALGVPHVELDACHWEPGWQEAPDERFFARLDAATSGDGWVVDGNYQKSQQRLWPRAQVVVWLDLPRRTVWRRVIVRTAIRGVRRQELWESGNRERLHEAFTRESVVLWSITTFNRRRREYRQLRESDAFPHLQWVHVRSAREQRALLTSLGRYHADRSRPDGRGGGNPVEESPDTTGQGAR